MEIKDITQLIIVKHKPYYIMKTVIPHLTILLLLAATVPDCMAQQGKDKKGDGEKVVVVDDESCGCELYFIDGIQTTERDGLFGFKREDGTVIVEPTYKFVDKFHGEYCIVYNDYERCGMIDRDGRIIVPVQYNEVNYPTDGMIRVREGELYGFLDTTGATVIKPQYRTASGFSEGLAVVIIDFDSFSCAYGFIDMNNKLVIPAIYEYAYPFQEGYAVVKQYDRFGVIDHKGKEMLPMRFLEISSMHEGNFFAVDRGESRAAMFDKRFKRLTPYIYDQIISYSEGFYVVQKGDKITFLDQKGKERFGMYNNVSGFNEGYSWVEKDGKYGIINRKGKTILPIEYDNSGYRSMEYMFSEGVFMVEKDGKFGFVDSKGRIVIPIQYQSAQHCTEGLIPVKKDGMWGYIDREGKTVIPFIFEAASFFEWGRAEVGYDGEVYKINPDGQCVKNCKTFPKTLNR